MLRLTLAAVTLLVAASGARAGGFDCTAFEKNPDGTWHALRSVQIYGPGGRIDFTPDETYKQGQQKMGLDMAKLLDMNCAAKPSEQR